MGTSTETTTIIEAGGGESYTRYAPYVEAHHSQMLRHVQWNAEAAASTRNPYQYYTELKHWTAFHQQERYSAGPNAMPALFWNWNRQIQDFNITRLWSTLFNDTVNGTNVNALVSAERDLLEDELDEQVLPRFQAGMRDINAVNSSTFIIGRALLEGNVQKQVAKFSAELKYRLIPLVMDRYKTHLSWQSGIVGSQMDALKTYFSVDQNYTALHWNIQGKYRKWPMEILDYYRTAVGTLQGATNSASNEHGEQVITREYPESLTSGYGAGAGPSSTQSAIGGALTGAGIGGMVGGPVGAAVGAGAGALLSMFD